MSAGCRYWMSTRILFLNKGAVSAEEFTDITSFGGGYGGSTDGSRNYMEAGGVSWTPEVSDEIQRIKRSTLYFTRMVNDLATFLGTSPVSSRC